MSNINVSRSLLGYDEDGKVICPNCEFHFERAARCPECGQLIDYSDKVIVSEEAVLSTLIELLKDEFHFDMAVDEKHAALKCFYPFSNQCMVTTYQKKKSIRLVCSLKDFDKFEMVDIAVSKQHRELGKEYIIEGEDFSEMYSKALEANRRMLEFMAKKYL